MLLELVELALKLLQLLLMGHLQLPAFCLEVIDDLDLVLDHLDCVIQLLVFLGYLILIRHNLPRLPHDLLIQSSLLLRKGLCSSLSRP